MTIRSLTGTAVETEGRLILNESRTAINSKLSSFELKSTFDVWFSTYRGIEELINLPSELKDGAFCNEVLGLNLLDIDSFMQKIPAINAGLKAQFTSSVAARLLQTLVQVSAAATSFAMHQIPAARDMATVGSAISYLQSRRRHLLAFLHTIPGACRGSQKLHQLDGLNQFMYLIETAGLATTSMHQSLMLARVYPDFELKVDIVGVRANYSFNALDTLFLEPERTAITEMTDASFNGLKRLPVSRSLIFSKAELANNLELIATAYAEFNLQDTSYGALANFIRNLIPEVLDDYFVRLSPEHFDDLCKATGTSESLKTALVVPDTDYVNNTSTYAPFTRVGGELVTSVTLLSRFANHWKNICLNRVRRYQIRSGFIFEKSVKAELREQGFNVTDIKRVGHAEFDVVATLDGVIYNVQCKNNLVDLNRIEADVKRFVRYNRTLGKAYERALEKERAREGLLLGVLNLTEIRHFVVSRFPVVMHNHNVLAFGQIHRFKTIAALS